MPFAYAAGIAAAGSIASGVIGANAAGDAAKTQAAAARDATNAQLQMYDSTVQREQPFLQAGTNALPALQRLLGLDASGTGSASSPLLAMLGYGGPGGTGAGNINPATFQGSPGYQYQMQQGNNAITNSAHGNIGGNALRALQANGQGLANQNWNQYLGNFGNAYQGLVGNVSNLVAGGQNAANGLGQIGTTVGGQIGSNMIGAGNAGAAGIMGGANALAGGINGVGQNGLLYALMNQRQSGGGGGGGLFDSLFGGGSGASYSSIDPYGQSVAPVPIGGWGGGP